MEILAVIPARGGSKGIPRKNIRPLNGRPLIYYTIEEAKKSKYVSRFIVSTEDQKISIISKKFGAEVLKRPKRLARDDTSTIDVIIHILKQLKRRENYTPDLIVLLQPTSPLRTNKDIDNAINTFLNCKKCLSLVSVTKFSHSPFWAFKIKNKYLSPAFGYKYLKTRRQKIPKLYRPNGAIFISTPKVLFKYKTFYTPKTIAYVMPLERSIDIDTNLDFLIAELLIKSDESDE